MLEECLLGFEERQRIGEKVAEVGEPSLWPYIPGGFPNEEELRAAAPDLWAANLSEAAAKAVDEAAEYVARSRPKKTEAEAS